MIQSNPHYYVRQRRQVRTGLVLSLLAHIGLVATVVAVPYGFWLWAPPSWESRSIEVVLADARDENPQAPEVRVVTDPSEVTGEMIEERLDALVARAEENSPDENLQQLDELTQRLDQVSSAESIGAMSESFRQMLGTGQRAAQPSDDAPQGPFDYHTAQLHDVRRIEHPNGSVAYVSVMIDADGRSMEVELSEADGEPLYQLVQQIKSNPLLEKIYREIAMPLLDKMIAEQKNAEQKNAGHGLPSLSVSEESANRDRADQEPN